MVSDPFTINDPVIKTDPVNWCVFVNNDPLRVEPVINSVDEVIVCATIVCAVNVPRTVKLSADEAVAAYDAEMAFST
jgi:hypothetical protein